MQNQLNVPLQLSAYVTTEYDHHVGAGHPQQFEFNAELPTKADAAEFAAQFPKSAKVFAGLLYTENGTRGWASAQASLVSDGVNGGVNETGLRRYRTIVKTAERLGIEILWVARAGNAYATREAFEAAIGQEVK